MQQHVLHAQETEIQWVLAVQQPLVVSKFSFSIFTNHYPKITIGISFTKHDINQWAVSNWKFVILILLKIPLGLCDQGYYLDSGNCVACGQGTYKDQISDATTCTSCTGNRNTMSTGSTAASSCK